MKANKSHKIDAALAVSEIKRLIEEMQTNPKIRKLIYKGPEITASSILAHSFNIRRALTKKQLTYDAENQGRAVIEVLLWKLFQLGYQQGEAYIKEEGMEETYRLLYINAISKLEKLENINKLI